MGKSGLEWFFLFYLLVVAVSFLVGDDYTGERLRQTLKMRWLITFYGLYFAMMVLPRGRLLRIVNMYLLFAAISCLYGVWEFFTWTAASAVRAGGLLNNTIAFGHSAALWFVMSLGFLRLKKYPLLFFVPLIIFAGLISSGTRGGILPVLAISPLFLLFYGKNIWGEFGKRRSKKNLVMGLSVLAVVIYPLFKMLLAAMGRTEVLFSDEVGGLPRSQLWAIHWAIFKDYPIWGVGLNYGHALAESYQDALGLNVIHRAGIPHAHNNYLQVLSGLGIMGAVAYLSMFGKIFMINLRGYWRATGASAIRHYLLALVICQIVFHMTGMVDTNFRFSIDKSNMLFLIALMLYFAKSPDFLPRDSFPAEEVGKHP